GNRPHWHRDFDEWWVVLDGVLEWELTGGTTLKAVKDDIVWVRRGTVHHIRNVGDRLSLRLAVAMPPAVHYASPCEQCGYTDDGHQLDLQQRRWADELGFSEACIGEHHTAPWEPHPAPDLLVAQALMQTTRMRIGPGGFLMPYHHPAELANRVAMLDHLAQGRLNFGVAASGLPSDWAMFNVDGNAGQHREMTREALDIILRLWSDEPEFDHKGKYWHVTKTGTMIDTLKPHIAPLQNPHPPIGVAGVSKGSDTLKLAGERGFWPMSLNLNPAY